jgi:hypothetical protein
MQISLVATSANRHFARSFIRVAASLDPIRRIQVPEAFVASGQLPSAFQVVIVDTPAPHCVVPASYEPGRLLRAQVGLPLSLTYQRTDDPHLVVAVFAAVDRAVSDSPLPVQVRQSISEDLARLQSAAAGPVC